MGVQVQAWDEVFIRCRRDAVNPLVVDVAGWDRWWAQATCAPEGDGVAVDLVVPRRLPRRQRLVVVPDRVRPRDKGLEFSTGGDLVGTGEWYHLDRADGVVVHYLLRGDLQGRLGRPGPARRWLATHRAAVRAGLTDLKARMEGGRAPGAEPDPALLAHQAEELATFAREVAQHQRELAQAQRAPRTASDADGAQA